MGLQYSNGEVDHHLISWSKRKEVTGLQAIEEVTVRSDKFTVYLFPSWLLEQSWACCVPPFPFTNILWTADPCVHRHKAACSLARRRSSSWTQALPLDLLCKLGTFIWSLLAPGMILGKTCVLHFSCLLCLWTLWDRQAVATCMFSTFHA